MDIRISEVNWSQQQQTLSAIRREVFIEEQQVPKELEWDGIDPVCRHVLAQDLSKKIAVGTGRLVADGQIGRMAILKKYRQQGIGRDILNQLIKIAKRDGQSLVYVHAQISALNFYQLASFEIIGESFMDAGIEHVKMILHLL